MAQREAEIAGFDVVSNPKFLRKGSALYDTFNPDCLVWGSDSPKAIAMMQKLCQPLGTREFAEDKSLPPVPVLGLIAFVKVRFFSSKFHRRFIDNCETNNNRKLFREIAEYLE
ncbi:MAG: hypothetical protein RLZZ499_1884 [Cyanobacteriota bacterium]